GIGAGTTPEELYRYIAQDEPAEFALMAYTSNSSRSNTEVQYCSKNCVKKYEKLQKQFDEQRQTLSKANLEIVSYQLGLESVEAYTSQTSNTSVEMPMFESVRPSGVIIEDWVSDDEDIFQSNDLQATNKPSFKRIEFTNARNESVKPKQAEKPRIITKNPRHPNTRISNEKVIRQSKIVNTAMQTALVWKKATTSLEEQRIFDSGCFRHMTGNKDFLTDYQDIDGGFVAFGGSARGGKITRKGKIRTDKLDFEDVFFVKELKRMGHVNFKTMNKLVKGNLVRGLPQKIFANDTYLCDLTEVEATPASLSTIRQEFSVARTPQQNGVAERKNRTLIEAARTMLADSLLPTVFEAEAVNTACNVLNRVLVTKPHNKTPNGTYNWQTTKHKTRPNWIFDIDSLTNSMNYQPVTAGNQTNKNKGPQEANGDTGLKKSVDARQTEGKEKFYFLGLQVKHKEDGIFISQDKYVGEILKKFGFSSIRTSNTPMETNKALTKDEDGEDVDVHLYRSMIRSLMYLTSSRPDIMFSVCACLRFQVQPKVSHLNANLKGQPNLGLWYPKDSPFILEAFSDSDYAGASLDRKSTTGGCQFLG
ncbi:uncharacterized mitochondrial protein-like protein, partial [Tanacetum coccineum]